MEFNLKGILPAVATAYDDEGRLSEARTERLYSHLVKNGVSGLFVGGSTGEWPLLTSSERKFMVSWVAPKIKRMMRLS